MSDRITTPNGVEVDDGRVIIVPGAGAVLPPTAATQAEYAALRAELAEYRARPDIRTLDDLSFVTEEGKKEGDILVCDSGGTWRVQPMPVGVNRVSQNWGPGTGVANATLLTVGQPLQVSIPSAGRAHITPVFGTTAGTFAAGMHAHALPSERVVPFGATGYLSSGSRQLTTFTVTTDATKNHYLRVDLNLQIRGGDDGACYYRLQINAGGSVKTTPSGSAGRWAVNGVPSDVSMIHSRQTGKVAQTAITATIIHGGAGGIYVDAGECRVTIWHER